VKCFFERKQPLKLGTIELQLFDRIPKESEANYADRIFVLMHGEAVFKLRDKSYRARRNDLFLSKPAAIYLPSGRDVRIEKESESFLMISAMINANHSTHSPAKIIRQRDVKTTYEGSASARSKERKIFENSSFACGETICQPGKWAFSEHAGSKATFFMLKQKNGFGFVRLWSPKKDEVHLIEDGCVVFSDGGKESIVAEPKTAVYALWFQKKEEKDGQKNI